MNNYGLLLILNLMIIFMFPQASYCNFDLDNFISPEDIKLLSESWASTTIPPTTRQAATEIDDMKLTPVKLVDNIYYFNLSFLANSSKSEKVFQSADCFGLGNYTSKLKWILDLKPQHSSELNVEFYFRNKRLKNRVQVFPGEQFGTEWTYYNPKKPTILIVHGFLSYSNASWVLNMTKAFLDWGDVNVIAVDWSRGGNTWKYWRAVANTRTVGADVAQFLQQLVNETGANIKDFHFIGHSLGAHICSFASNKLGGVRRITGLDPAQPCFITTDLNNLLDKSDADFVDVIHTNGRALANLGLGVPNTCGHQDFYPNGGMKQPGCQNEGKPTFISKYLPISPDRLARAICNHGRAYLLFTESLKNHNCSLIGRKWNLSYKGVNASFNIPCTNTSCTELGIRSDMSPARGSFYVVTSSKKPFCVEKEVKIETRYVLLSDLLNENTTTTTDNPISTTDNPKIKKAWFSMGRWFGNS
ncbi:phospholipase A1-like [Arctopsyche grandis]|uniref:phospholipase A1-like n=1 Tax=Arctopsyche grandis TaxID=121162 RepID=UPI00406D6AAA